MPESAECVEAVFSVDEIIVWAVINGGVHRADCCREVRKDAVKLAVQIIAVVDTVFFLELFKERLPPLLSRVVVIDLRVHLVCSDCTADDCADDALRARLRDGGSRGNPRHQCGGKCKCNSLVCPFFPVHKSSLSHESMNTL